MGTVDGRQPAPGAQHFDGRGLTEADRQNRRPSPLFGVEPGADPRHLRDQLRPPEAVREPLRQGAPLAFSTLDLGRDIYGVPGPIDRTTHSGVNAMLRDGAGVLDDPELFATDFAERFGLVSAKSPGPLVSEGSNTRTVGGFGSGMPGAAVPEPDIARVLDAIDRGARTMEAVRDELRLETSETLALLTQMEIAQ